MAVNNNLYPPVINTYMPAFLVDDEIVKVYFSLSNYNSESDIKNVQVTLLNQKTNTTALDSTKYPSQIMITTLQKDSTITTDEKYYIEIKASDLKNQAFAIDQYYKVQLRFTATTATDVSLDTPQAIDSWLSANLQYFSEWSTICLLRGISTPILSIQDFDTLGAEVEWKTSIMKLVGNIEFVDSSETETLKSYRIKLYDSMGVLLTDSGLQYTDSYNPNEFTYTINYSLINGAHYSFAIEYTTQNLYTETNTYKFVAIQDTSISFSVNSFTIEADEEEGRLKISASGSDAFADTLAILRSSSETNYTIWEDVHTVVLNQTAFNYIWYDKTVESGILYKYAVQKRHLIDNTQSIMIKNADPAGVILDHAFLTRNDAQLKIKFNPGINSMKRVITDTKVDTIGSQFPYIRRTGSTNYRTFPISGLVSFLMDESELFTSREKVFGSDNVSLYDNFNSDNDISIYNDYTYEREFRKKVSEFLSADNVKLFRSATEGNILVRLTDVSFSPNTSLGRYIWTFSATAYEIDNCSIEKYDEYGIQSIGGE